MVTLAWMFGAIWSNVTSGAPMTLFARGLGATPMQFGVLAALPYVAALFCVFGSLISERTGERKRIFLNAFYLQRVLWIVIAIAPVLMLNWYGQAAAPRAMQLVLMLVFVACVAGSIGGPAWTSWMSNVVPRRIRGIYFARRRQWGLVTAVPAALLIGFGLDLWATDTASMWLAGVPPIVFWCASLFAVTAFFGLADIGCFQPLPHTPHPPQRGSELLRAMAEPLHDRPFLILSSFVGVVNFTVAFTNQFATLYVIERVKVGNLQTQLMLLVMPMALQFLLLPAWGAAVDRMGKKPLLILASIGLIPMGFGWCLMGQGMAWLGYALYACGTTLWTGMEVANFAAVIDASGTPATASGRRTTARSGYHAVNTVIINVGGCVGGLAAGLIASGLQDWSWQPIAGLRAVDSYDALFILSGTVRMGAVIAIAPLLYEPSAKSLLATSRYLAAHLASSVNERISALLVWVKPPMDRPQSDNLPFPLQATPDLQAQHRPAA